MKAKSKRKMYSRALHAELKASTNKTKKQRQPAPEHEFFKELDKWVEE